MRLRPARLDRLSKWLVKLVRDAPFEHSREKLWVDFGDEIMRL